MLANGLQTSLGTEVVMFMHSSAARFPMTRGAMVKFATALTALILLVVLPLQFAVMVRVPVPEVRALALTVLVVVGLGLVFTVMLAPNAVRIEGGRLVVERCCGATSRCRCGSSRAPSSGLSSSCSVTSGGWRATAG